MSGKENNGEHDSQQREEGDGVAHHLRDHRFVAGTDSPRCANGSTHGKPNEYDGDEVHHLCSIRHSSNTVHPALKPDEKHVCQTVEHLKEIGEHVGKRKCKDIAQDASPGQVL